MKEKHSGRSKSLLLNWLVSYGIILLLSFSFILISYLYLYRNLKNESIRVHRETVRQSQISMDYLLQEINMIVNEVKLLPQVESLGGYNGDLGPRQYYLKKLLRDDLYKLKRSHPGIETLYLYFSPADYVVSETAAYEADYFFDTFYGSSGLTEEEWKQLLLTRGHMTTVTLNQVISGSGDGPVPQIQFINTHLHYGENGEPRVSICLTVSEKTLLNLLGGTLRGSEYFIMDGNRQTLLIDREDLPDRFPGYEGLVSHPEKTWVLDGNMITAYPSKVTDWLFVSLSSLSEIQVGMNRIRWIFLILVLVFWLVGSFMAIQFSRRNYKPVTKLMDFVSGKRTEGEAVHFRREEYRYIEESFNRLREEKASIQDQLTLQKESLRLRFLTRLLTGKLRETSHSLEEQCQYQDFFFEEDAFVTVLMKMEETVLNDSLLSQEKGAQWLSTQIQAVLSDFTQGSGWVCDISNLTVLFINLQVPSDDPQLMLIALLGELKNRILMETGVTYTIGCSSYKTELSAVPLSYEEALDALDFRMVKGKGAVISYYDIMENDQRQKVFSVQNWEKRFINLFTLGSYDEAAQILSNALNQLELLKNLDVFRLRLFGILNTFLDALGESFDESFISELNCEASLLACTTLNETRKEMDRIFFRIREYTLGQKEASLQERVKEILEENLFDPNLSVGYIADRMGLSISNFSWLYKEETGMGPLDCIHRTRLREAKALLSGTERTVKNIAEHCGYLSDIAFIRVFKKYEGITPGQFRQEKKKIPLPV